MDRKQEQKQEEGDEQVELMPPHAEALARQKKSFTHAFTNITTKSFTRRRTAPIPHRLASSSTAESVSSIPASSSIPESSSLISNSNLSAPKPVSTKGQSEETRQATALISPRFISFNTRLPSSNLPDSSSSISNLNTRGCTSTSTNGESEGVGQVTASNPPYLVSPNTVLSSSSIPTSSSIPEGFSSCSNWNNFASKLATTKDQIENSEQATALTTPQLASFSTALSSSNTLTCSSVPKSSSFISNLNAFAPKSTSIKGQTKSSEQTATPKPSRRISDRLAQTPFFQNRRFTATPVKSKRKSETNVQIQQHSLMAPLQPPLPRDSTLNNIRQGERAQNSPRTPSFMRPTSSSTARRASLSTPKPRQTPMSFIPAGKTTSSERRTASYGFKPSVKTPTSQRGKLSLVASQSEIFSSNPETRTFVSPTNEPEKVDIYASTGKLYDEGKATNVVQGASSFVRPIRKSSLIPAPTYLRTHTRQEKANPYTTNATVSSSDFGNDGATGSRGLQEQDTSVEDGFVEEIREVDSVETVVPTSKSNDRIEDQSVSSSANQETQAGNPSELDGSSSANKDADANESSASSDPDLPRDLDDDDPRLVYTSFPTAYWAGRFQSLSDRFRTSALSGSPSHPMHDEQLRAKRVYRHLYSFCVTNDAKDSLAAWIIRKEGSDKERAGGPKGPQVKERHGFFQALMGKKR